MVVAAPISLTLSEASYVVGRPSRAINKAVDRGLIRATLQRRGKTTLRKLGPAELRFLKLADELEMDLTPKGRRRLYEALQRLPLSTHRLALGRLELNLGDIDRQISERLRRLEEVKAVIEPGTAGEPVIRGTGIPVHLIAGLARGQTVDEIREDLPSLSPEQVAAAVEYSKAYPKPGRPYPPRSFTRMLGDLGNATQGVDAAPANLGPRLIP